MARERNRNTIIIWGAFTLLLFTGITTALFESEDIDELCNTANSMLTRINGTWQCSVTSYGEIYTTRS